MRQVSTLDFSRGVGMDLKIDTGISKAALRILKTIELVVSERSLVL
jgi:hypothetical protein